MPGGDCWKPLLCQAQTGKLPARFRGEEIAIGAANMVGRRGT